MVEVQKADGVGSVWNINSWHWEHKNYTEVAKKIITEKISKMKFVEGGLKVSTQSLKNIKGEALINIRKGKQILCYEFNIEVSWIGEEGVEEVEGTYKINDLNESDLDFEVIEITCKEDNDIGNKSRNLLKRMLKNELNNLFKTFNEELNQLESDPKKLEEDKIKREKAMQETLKAKMEKGEEKERLLDEQRAKEKKMKEDFSKWKQKDEENKPVETTN